MGLPAPLRRPVFLASPSHSSSPYFTPDSGSLLDGDVEAPGVGNQATHLDATAFNQPLTNYYYVVLAVDADGVKSPASNRVAVFHFTLTPGTQ
jgi:hypothetical protein